MCERPGVCKATGSFAFREHFLIYPSSLLMVRWLNFLPLTHPLRLEPQGTMEPLPPYTREERIRERCHASKALCKRVRRRCSESRALWDESRQLLNSSRYAGITTAWTCAALAFA